MSDSTSETLEHISKVQGYMQAAAANLLTRATVHDQSKLESPEKEAFDRVTERLRGLTYGSPEYKASLAELGPALDHHYAHNSHHPQHYMTWVCNGCFQTFEVEPKWCHVCGYTQLTPEPTVGRMSLFDVLEMLMDWKAAGERHADGSIERSLKINKDRFKISDQLQSVLEATAREMGWMTPTPDRKTP